LIIGTEEEWLIAGGVPGDLIASLQAVRKCTGAVMVVKRGAIGCSIIQGEVPSKLDDALTILGERIEVLNVLGAGDAFASGLLSGLLQGKGFAESARIANACGALVVSRHGCAPAMPCPAELDYWFSSERQSRPDQDPQLAHLHRVGVSRPQWPELYVLAFDHRSQFEDLAQQVGADPQRIAALKRLLVDVVKEVSQLPGMPGKIGLLVDGGRGEAALHHATGCGFWLGRPIELPGSRPLQFDGYRSLASQLLHWPKEQVVKCLVFYDRNDPEAMRQSQDEQLMHVWEATRASGHELLLEIIPPKDRIAPEQSDDSVLDSISHLYALGLKPEWWKVGAMSATAWQRLDTLVRANDPYCRGAVILGLNQPLDQLVDSFVQAQAPVVKGFMVGRSVWVEPAGLWLSGQIDDQVLRRQVQANFTRLITGWQGSRRPSSDASNAMHGVTEKEISE
jgi:5-dehydro-2-deoxygluconokinase